MVANSKCSANEKTTSDKEWKVNHEDLLAFIGMAMRLRQYLPGWVRLLLAYLVTLYCCHAENDAGEIEIDAARGDVHWSVAPEQQQKVPCGIWVAPSTLKGAGLGMFAGQDYEEDDVLERDISIPIIDIENHHPEPFTFLWDSYVWDGDIHQCRLGYHIVNAACPGFGSAANSFMPLVNIRVWNSEPDAVGLHRSTDPGAGAFTLYWNRMSTATRNIQAGEEFFISYGDYWFKARPYLGPIPLEDDLDHATELFQKYLALKQELLAQGTPAVVIQELWDTLVRNTQFTDSRVIGGFHHDDAEELEILESRNITLTQLRIEQSTQSPEWLAEHGTCADHMEARPSTIEQAGHGAFARRALPKGTIVAQLPLIHIPDKRVLEMYHLNATNHPDPSLGVSGLQLIINYCYGHAESSLVLCPYGPLVNFINHNQTLANVKIQWSHPTKGNHNPSLLDVALDHLDKDSTAKLAFEIVALQDIAADEELFLDYGDEWEHAWQAHVQQWKPVADAEEYESAQTMNEDATVPTVFELMEDPSLVRDNMDLWCYGIFESRPDEWREEHEKGTLGDWIYFMITRHTEELTRCDNLRVETNDDGEELYTAIMWDEETGEELGMLVDVPRQALLYRDRPYTSDVHLPNVFRHVIGIPDEIFPLAWRNRR